MVKPERRTKADVLAAAAIVAVVAVAAALIWWTSDARATISRPAVMPVPSPKSAREVPAALKQLWSAANATTDQPVVVGGTIVTADRRTIAGRDPATGQVRWSYSPNSDLCGVSWVYRYAVAVYRDDRGCGQVSTIDGSTGRRGPARTSYADRRVSLSSDGNAVLSAGETRLELWRSDMVRMLSYGEIDARVKPSSKGLHTGCRLVSAAASSAAVSVLGACGSQADLRLTLLRPSKEEDEPEQRDVTEPGIAVGSGARVLTVAETSRSLIYLPAPQPKVEVIDETGTTVASTLLPKPPSTSSVVSRSGNLFTWWTGDTVMVFDAANLTYRYSIAAAGPAVPVGPATMMAGKLLVPVTGGIAVCDPVTGDVARYLPVTRPPGSSPVIPVVSGSQVIEQRGNTLVALG
jgi:PQQ-like domain